MISLYFAFLITLLIDNLIFQGFFPLSTHRITYMDQIYNSSGPFPFLKSIQKYNKASYHSFYYFLSQEYDFYSYIKCYKPILISQYYKCEYYNIQLSFSYHY